MKKSRILFVVGLVLFGFMLASLLLMSLSLEDSEQFGGLFNYLLAFNSFGILTLIGLIILNFRRLARELHNHVAGAIMTLRMVILFSFLSIIPVLILYYFSLDFLLRGIDNWFDLRVEKALDNSLELSRLALDTRMRELLKQTEQIADELTEISEVELPFEIDTLREKNFAEEFTVVNKLGNVVTSSTDNNINLVPDELNETILVQLEQGISYVDLDPGRDNKLYIRVVVNIPGGILGHSEKYIQALYPIDERMNKLADQVQDAFVQYKKLSYLKQQLKLSFVMILTIVLLFSIFSVVWTAFYSAKQLAAPIRDLAEGTRAIAAGEYDKEIPVTSHDELGFLVASFNKMSQRVGLAQEQAFRSQMEAEEQHARLEAVLANLSSGVIVFTHEVGIKIINCNESAANILGVKTTELLEIEISTLIQNHNKLKSFFYFIRENIIARNKQWRSQQTLFEHAHRKELIMSGATLEHQKFSESGTVVVFDDITALIQGQKDAAWSEVARRLAHEIKNPLTPIRLAAERLRHKYSTILQGNDSETLHRLTGTIVQQVDTMKEMVNNFSDYAISNIEKDTSCEVNSLIQSTVDLYSNNEKSIYFKCSYSRELPTIVGNAKQITQVMNNLIKNAIEVSEEHGTIIINTINENDESILIEIHDSGTGIDDNIRDKIFDPYVTTKPKGTGLGLAIVKKIVEEHGGAIWIENNTNGIGASAKVQLPAQKKYSTSESV